MRNQRKLAQKYQPMTQTKVPSLEVISRQPIFSGGGEMGALVRSFDWAKTPLGLPHTWSPALKSTTRLVLANCCPMLLWWGPDFYQIYNDAYIPVLGDKHPHCALGKPFREVLVRSLSSPRATGPVATRRWSTDLDGRHLARSQPFSASMKKRISPSDTAPYQMTLRLAASEECWPRFTKSRGKFYLNAAWRFSAISVQGPRKQKPPKKHARWPP